ncbi:MAG: hypothetical protein ACLFTT_16440 [Candidatus Hydrogenedentota bacterium]
MRLRLEKHTPWLIPVALLAAGLAVGWTWLCTAFRAEADALATLVASVLPDDAFYYFEIAQQFWAGIGFPTEAYAQEVIRCEP